MRYWGFDCSRTELCGHVTDGKTKLSLSVSFNWTVVLDASWIIIECSANPLQRQMYKIYANWSARFAYFEYSVNIGLKIETKAPNKTYMWNIRGSNFCHEDVSLILRFISENVRALTLWGEYIIADIGKGLYPNVSTISGMG